MNGDKLSSRDLGVMPYRAAWAEQEAVHGSVVAGTSAGAILTVEHPPVITFGRRAEVSASHLLASQELLAGRGVEVVESDRGGDITFHGPGQLVVYPILRLADYRLSVGAYVRLLQDGVVDVLAGLGVAAWLEEGAVGVWVRGPRGVSKVCAIGVRVRGGVTLHGLALNLSTDLTYFDLIVPCGLTGRPVTSLAEVLGDKAPTMEDLKQRVVATLLQRLAERRG